MLGKSPSFVNLIADEIGHHPHHSQHTEAASVGHRRHQLRSCHTAHARLDDRMANPQFFGESCGDHGWASDVILLKALFINIPVWIIKRARGVTVPNSFQRLGIIRNEMTSVLTASFRGIARRLDQEYLCESKVLRPISHDLLNSCAAPNLQTARSSVMMFWAGIESKVLCVACRDPDN